MNKPYSKLESLIPSSKPYVEVTLKFSNLEPLLQSLGWVEIGKRDVVIVEMETERMRVRRKMGARSAELLFRISGDWKTTGVLKVAFNPKYFISALAALQPEKTNRFASPFTMKRNPC